MLTIAGLSAFGLTLVSPALHRLAREKAGWLLAILPVALAVYFGSQIGRINDGEVVIASTEWVPTLGIVLSFRLDGLSLLFSLLISGIGALVVVYSGGYLAGHPQLGRFYAYILLFMASMLGLVLADNVFTLFIFWELTSISSYLLIGFEHEREQARRSALQALLVTGIGGLGLLAGLVMLALVGGSTEISDLLAAGNQVRHHHLYIPILLLVLGGTFTKSAQFPFHFWLPNAMEAPTPVSAYLHSATMVKAGVYLLMRLTPVLGETDTWFYFLTVAGAITMVMGAFVAIIETDFKRVLAYSTLSVLGLLTMLVGEGSEPAIKAAVMFLLAHALYKGALFLVAGAVDHETGERSLDRLGGLYRAMPLTTAAAVLAAISLAGLAPTFAFIAKEAVFEAITHGSEAPAVFTAATVGAAALLVGVAGAAGFKPFFGERRETPRKPHEAPPSIWGGPALLAAVGFALGLVPASVTDDLVAPAANAIAGEEVKVSIALWHGFSAPLLLSALSIASGVGLYLAITQIRRWCQHLRSLSALAAETWYERGMAGLNLVATAQTRVLQDGYLRHYVLIVIVASAGLAGYTLLFKASIEALPEWGDIRFHEAIVAAIILFGGAAAVIARSRLAAVTALGIVGYSIALLYLLFGAPDLAMTQVLVETLTVLIFVLVLYHLPREVSFSRATTRLRDGVIATAVGGLMAALILVANSSRSHPSISHFFAEKSKPEAFGRNVVNVILVDFRALDTLGEITVLTLAGAGVYALLKLRPRKREDKE